MGLCPSNWLAEIDHGPIFPNMAGSQCKPYVIAGELLCARIEVVPDQSTKGMEVDCRLVGRYKGWTFRRLWYYWAAEGPEIPLVYAKALHESHGKEVRVHGDCGAPAPTGPVGHYHVDTQSGLNALMATIRHVETANVD